MEKRTKKNPWKLQTPSLSLRYEMYIEEKDEREIIVCIARKKTFYYDARIINDLYEMLKENGDWVMLASRGEKTGALKNTVEYWARSSHNPIGGWYGMKKGLRGRVGLYIPPLMEALGLAELEHNSRNNRMRAKQ